MNCSMKKRAIGIIMRKDIYPRLIRLWVILFLKEIETHLKAVKLSPDWSFPKSRIAVSFPCLKDKSFAREYIERLEEIDPSLAESLKAKF